MHQIDNKLLEGLWNQFGNRKQAQDGIVTTWKNSGHDFPQTIQAPSLPGFYKVDPSKADMGGMHLRNGFTIDICFNLANIEEGQVLLDARDSTGKGWSVSTTADATIQLSLCDVRTRSVWDCDKNMLQPGKDHYVSIIVDGGPQIIAFVVDGILNDGGDTRQFGWGRFSPYLQSVSGSKELVIGEKINGNIKSVTIYNRALTISEAIGNYNSFLK